MRDECFIRGKVPMTKSEVRAVSLDKLELRDGEVFYDVGAGTGSVAVEAALRCPHSRVYALEQKAEGCELISGNREKFGADNLTVVPGKAPETFRELPAPDKVFIGGSGGSLGAILKAVREANPQVRIVVNVITLETLSELTSYLEREGLEAEVVSIQVSRAQKLGCYHLMQAMNPVWVVTFGGEEPDRQENG